MRSLGSDNHAGVHPKILEALMQVNQDHSPSYGTDDLTKKFREKAKELFGSTTESFFVFNGTAANVLCLKALVQSFETIFCSHNSHLYLDECAAPEHIIGCKLQPIVSVNGKIKPEQIEPYLVRLGDQHHSQPGAVSLTQPTELGTLYSFKELQSWSQFCKEHNLKLHIDGARFIYAPYGLKKSFKELTSDLEIHALSFGGTKNGLLFGECCMFFNTDLAKKFKFIRKQNMQLPSKMRFLAAQFLALFENELWQEIADHGNQLALQLEEGLKDIPEIKITQPVEANSVFAIIPKKWVKPLRKHYFFYIFDEATFEARLMISFDSTKEDIERFIKEITKLSSL